jgi:phage shock protein E
MDIDKVRAEIERGEAILIDVREQSEWDESHLRHAQLIPLSLFETEEAFFNLPNDKIIYTHCRLGRRAARAAELMKDQFPLVKALPFTFDELQQKSL